MSTALLLGAYAALREDTSESTSCGSDCGGLTLIQGLGYDGDGYRRSGSIPALAYKLCKTTDLRLLAENFDTDANWEDVAAAYAIDLYSNKQDRQWAFDACIDGSKARGGA